jgi:hypothetical protein
MRNPVRNSIRAKCHIACVCGVKCHAMKYIVTRLFIWYAYHIQHVIIVDIVCIGCVMTCVSHVVVVLKVCPPENAFCQMRYQVRNSIHTKCHTACVCGVKCHAMKRVHHIVTSLFIWYAYHIQHVIRVDIMCIRCVMTCVSHVVGLRHGIRMIVNTAQVVL